MSLEVSIEEYNIDLSIWFRELRYQGAVEAKVQINDDLLLNAINQYNKKEFMSTLEFIQDMLI